MKASRSHRARKELFQRGIQRGKLTVQEIERAVPDGSLTDAERWLLYYSLRASGVKIEDERGVPFELDEAPAARGE